MSQFLLEILCEEIPARMQSKASEDLKRLLLTGMDAAGLAYDPQSVIAHVTPRRLMFAVSGVPQTTPKGCEERKGPRVASSPQAIAGFLKSNGLTDIAQASVVSDPKKGDFYIFRKECEGKQAVTVLAELVSEVFRIFPWPKSMHWGTENTSWVRPLRGLVCLFLSPEFGAQVIPCEIAGIVSGDMTWGHRFMGEREPVRVPSFPEYVAGLLRSYVVLDRNERYRKILSSARELAAAKGVELVEDERLLQEVVGLVEWPVVLMGTFDEEFLGIPDEIIQMTIRTNQKCFVVRDPASGLLSNHFLLVANIDPEDQGAQIVSGNERVIAARLADARFFYEQDLRLTLEERVERLKGIIFHEKLGSQYARLERMISRSVRVSPMVGADPTLAARAARLSKADLVTEIVGEFPELQGRMGCHYALKQGEDEAVAQAIKEHYSPQGPSDPVPSQPVSIAVSLADKFDILVGFWSIGEVPTGSKDPYALRRAALGVIRILLENRLRIPLLPEILGNQDLLAFFLERFRVHLRGQGVEPSFIEAALSVEQKDDLLGVQERIHALQRFLETPEGQQCMMQLKRVHNFLRIEEKRGGMPESNLVNPQWFAVAEEGALALALERVTPQVEHSVAKFDFFLALQSFSGLSPSIEVFLDQVLVNVEEVHLRENRLNLLMQIWNTALKIADFSKVEGRKEISHC